MGQGMSVEQRRFLESIEYEGNYEFILEMLKTSANTLNLKGECGTIAMILACHFGHTKCAEVLLLAGCSAVAAADNPPPQIYGDERQITPLYAAARSGSAGCIRLCLKHHANLKARTSAGNTPEDVVKASGRAEAMRVMKSAPQTQAAFDERRNSAYTRAHLGLDRIARQAIAVHIIDFTEDGKETRFEIESEDNFKSRFTDKSEDGGGGEDARSIYTVHRSVSDFKKMHEELCSEYSTMPPGSFTMAPRRLTYEENCERMRQLQDYLRFALSVVERAAGGGLNRFRGGGKKGRDVAELPIQLVTFLGLEDSDYPEQLRPVVQSLKAANSPAKNRPDAAAQPPEAETAAAEDASASGGDIGSMLLSMLGGGGAAAGASTSVDGTVTAPASPPPPAASQATPAALE